MATQHGLECVVVGRLIACCCFWWREQAYTKTAIHLHLQRFVIRLADNKASQNSNVMLELKLDNLDANISMIVPETCVHVVAELPSLVAIDSHVGRDRLRAEVSVGGIVFRDLNAPHNATPLLNSRLKPVLQFHPSPLKLPRAVHRSEEDESGEAMEGDSERMLSGKPAFAQLLRNHEHFNILSSFVRGFRGRAVCDCVCLCVGWVTLPDCGLCVQVEQTRHTRVDEDVHVHMLQLWSCFELYRCVGRACACSLGVGTVLGSSDVVCGLSPSPSSVTNALKRRQAVEHIYLKYLADGAPHQISFADNLIKAVKLKLDGSLRAWDDASSEGLFDGMRTQVEECLEDELLAKFMDSHWCGLHHRFRERCGLYGAEVKKHCSTELPHQSLLVLMEKREDRSSLAASRAGLNDTDPDLERDLAQVRQQLEEVEKQQPPRPQSLTRSPSGRLTSPSLQPAAALHSLPELDGGAGAMGTPGTPTADAASSGGAGAGVGVGAGGSAVAGAGVGVGAGGGAATNGTPSAVALQAAQLSAAARSPTLSPSKRFFGTRSFRRAFGVGPMPGVSRRLLSSSRRLRASLSLVHRPSSTSEVSSRPRVEYPLFGVMLKLNHSFKSWEKYNYRISPDKYVFLSGLPLPQVKPLTCRAALMLCVARQKLLYSKVGSNSPPKELQLVPGVRVVLAHDDPEAQSYVPSKNRRRNDFVQHGLVLTFEPLDSSALAAEVEQELEGDKSDDSGDEERKTRTGITGKLSTLVFSRRGRDTPTRKRAKSAGAVTQYVVYFGCHVASSPCCVSHCMSVCGVGGVGDGVVAVCSCVSQLPHP